MTFRGVAVVRVRLDLLDKTYPHGSHALAEVCLDVAEGERVCVVGPSGSGKTTLLRLVAGLERPTGGSVRFDDREVTGLPPKDRDVAMVFQQPALYPHLSAGGNIAFPLRMRGQPRTAIAQAVSRAAAVLGIERLLERRPHELSGGEAQRVALARAIVRRPACFLLDEPLAALDAPLRRQLCGELEALHAALRITTIHVTHDQAEALRLGDRVAVIHQGRLQQVGSPEDVRRRPENAFVAEFFAP